MVKLENILVLEAISLRSVHSLSYRLIDWNNALMHQINCVINSFLSQQNVIKKVTVPVIGLYRLNLEFLGHCVLIVQIHLLAQLLKIQIVYRVIILSDKLSVDLEIANIFI